jgi:hypothetical protein
MPRIYRLTSNAPRARELLAMPPHVSEPDEPKVAEPGEPRAHHCPCPCCGGRMLIIVG